VLSNVQKCGTPVAICNFNVTVSFNQQFRDETPALEASKSSFPSSAPSSEEKAVLDVSEGNTILPRWLRTFVRLLYCLARSISSVWCFVYYESIKRGLKKRLIYGIGTMKDYKLKMRNLHTSQKLGWSWNWST
jgi:hypothetical protein